MDGLDSVHIDPATSEEPTEKAPWPPHGVGRAGKLVSTVLVAGPGWHCALMTLGTPLPRCEARGMGQRWGRWQWCRRDVRVTNGVERQHRGLQRCAPLWPIPGFPEPQVRSVRTRCSRVKG